MVKNKKYLLIIGFSVLILVLIGAIYFGGKRINISNEYGNNRVPDKSTANSNDKTLNEDSANPPVDYLIVTNKKEGDIFSVPDDVEYDITPSVDKTKIEIRDSSGAILYSEEVVSTKGVITVYPSGRLRDGDTGTLVITGLKGDESVVSKNINILF